MRQHEYKTEADCNCLQTGCVVCDGALAYCKICGGFEGSLTTECAGVKLTQEKLDLVYAGKADFKRGMWVNSRSGHAPQPDLKAALSPRQNQILNLYADGYSSSRIAKRLGISQGTVKVHKKNAHRTLGESSTAAIFHRYNVCATDTRNISAVANLGEDLRQVFELIIQAKSNEEIAEQLGLTAALTKTRVRRLLLAIDANHRAHAIAMWNAEQLRKADLWAI